jgi:hypothetical protein
MVRVVIFILIAILNCAKPEAANPNDQGTDEFWQKQAFLCLVGQINLCTSTPPSPAAPTVTAGNTENTVTWSSVSGATSYNLVYGTSAGVTRASGTVISSVVSPYTHSGLTNNTTYYYTVVAKVGTTESNLSQEASATPFCSPCRIFGTSSLYDGILGGISGADAKCSTDANKPTSPSSSIYKAMLADVSNRIACTSSSCATSGLAEHKDWVFQPNRTYVRANDGATIVITDSVGIWSSGTTISEALPTNFTNGIFTGLAMSHAWTTNVNTCSNWSSTAGSGGFTSNSINIGNSTNGGSCSVGGFKILCVEQ